MNSEAFIRQSRDLPLPRVNHAQIRGSIQGSIENIVGILNLKSEIRDVRLAVKISKYIRTTPQACFAHCSKSTQILLVEMKYTYTTDKYLNILIIYALKSNLSGSLSILTAK